MTTLGRYQLFDKLGTGSMGTVYRAQDTILEREIALKTIRTDGDTHPELRERFYREARACARLQHPSIVVVHDLGEVDQVAYIAMELLDGIDFRRLIEQRVEIPLAVRLDVMAQICDALGYAHRRSIIHRDIKPSNLFLIEMRHAKVLDFGIARMPSSQLTQGKILGTPNYMAPEQVLGKPTDGRSDLFSAAVVFFELLVYAHPFQGENIPRRIVEDTPDPLRAAERRLPVLLERVFARGLAKEPDQRYQTGDEFAADLRAVADLLLQNASPSFSRAPLPSERDLSSRTQPPPDDIYELRLAELMQLIPEFESAMAQGDTTLARQILARLEAIGAADPRCTDAIKLCRLRLMDDQSPGGTGQSLQRPQDTSSAGSPADTTSPKVCAYCGAANRAAAMYCIKCGARMSTAGAAPAVRPPVMPDVPAVPPAATPRTTEAPTEPSLDATGLFQRTSVTPMPVPTPQQGEDPPPPPVRSSADEAAAEMPPGPQPQAVPPYHPDPSPTAGPKPQDLLPEKLKTWSALLRALDPRQKQLIWLAGGLLIAIVLMIVIAQSFKPEVVQKYVAQAQVKTPLAYIYAKADRSSRSITVRQGELIHLLQVPQASGDAWLPVQLVRKDKVWPKGYMRTSQLEKWSGDPGLKLKFFMLFPGDFEDYGPEQKIYALKGLIDDAPDSPDAQRAHVQLAKLEVALAEQKQAAGSPEADWTAWLDSAGKELEAGKNPQDAGDVEAYLTRIAALKASVTPEPTKAIATPPVRRTNPHVEAQKYAQAAGALFEQSKALHQSDEVLAKLNEAEKAAKKALDLEPENHDAQNVLDHIERRKRAFSP
jgi:serine/threonine protein kinase/tetratricopeptide (TPR) repeat protein